MQASEGITRQNLEATNLEKLVPDGLAAKVNQQTGRGEDEDSGFVVATVFVNKKQKRMHFFSLGALKRCQMYEIVSQHKSKMKFLFNLMVKKTYYRLSLLLLLLTLFKSCDNVATVTIITFITACKYYPFSAPV